VQFTFRLFLDRLACDLFDVVAWHLLLLFFQWCLSFPLHEGLARHKETKVHLRWVFFGDYEEFKAKHFLRI
jgi:hypothetical protein